MARRPDLMDDFSLSATIDTFRDTQKSIGLSKSDERRLAELLEEQQKRSESRVAALEAR